MDATNLSDYQLYELIKNPKLASLIRKVAEEEFIKRKLNPEQIEMLETSHLLQFPNENSEPLKSSYKLLLVAFPFFTGLHSLIAGRLLAKGQSRKWNDYWKYLCLGFLLWTVVIVLYVWFDTFD